MLQHEGAFRPLTYTSGERETEIPGYLAVPDGDGPYPAVLILRGVAGPEDGYTEIARRLAEWGYVALLHGWKVRGDDPPDAPVYDDLEGAFDFLLSLDQVDGKRLAVFGKACAFKFFDGVRHGFAVRTHPGYDSDAANQSFDEAKRFMEKHLQGRA